MATGTTGSICRFDDISEITLANSKEQTFLRRWGHACWKLACRLASLRPSAALIADILGAALVLSYLLTIALLQWMSPVLFMTPMAKHPWCIVRFCNATCDSLDLIALFSYWFTFGGCVAATASFLTSRRGDRRIPWIGIVGFAVATLILFYAPD